MTKVKQIRLNGDKGFRMGTLLFITAGPYFWPHQRTQLAKYELLSQRFSGYIISFVSRKYWRYVKIGNFELMACYISGFAYSFLPLRLLVRFLFVITRTIYLHFFKQKIDVIIACDPFVTGLLAYILSKLTSAKFIVELNGDYTNAASWNMRSLDFGTYLKVAYVHIMVPFILNRAHAARLLYKTQVKCFSRLRSENRFCCFHDFVPTSLFYMGSSESKTVLFVGHPWYTKGVDILIKAFNKISPAFPEYVLTIVGYLPEKDQYEDLFEKNSQINFVGPVFPDDVIKLMAECSLFVLPSRSEAMGRVLIEAMASKKPIIASRVGGIPYYINHGETGLLFGKEDVSDLAELMRRIMADETYARQLGQNGYQYVQNHLSEQCYLDHFTKLVEKALGNSPA